MVENKALLSIRSPPFFSLETVASLVSIGRHYALTGGRVNIDSYREGLIRLSSLVNQWHRQQCRWI